MITYLLKGLLKILFWLFIRLPFGCIVIFVGVLLCIFRLLREAGVGFIQSGLRIIAF